VNDLLPVAWLTFNPRPANSPMSRAAITSISGPRRQIASNHLQPTSAGWPTILSRPKPAYPCMTPIGLSSSPPTWLSLPSPPPPAQEKLGVHTYTPSVTPAMPFFT
jgi:hypothetical protein